MAPFSPGKGGYMSANASDKKEGVQGGKIRALSDGQRSDDEKDGGGEQTNINA